MLLTAPQQAWQVSAAKTTKQQDRVTTHPMATVNVATMAENKELTEGHTVCML